MNSRERGSVLLELAISVVIIMILSTLSISTAIQAWQSEQAYTVTLELSGWLNMVHRAALRGKSCLVTIAPNSNPLTSNAVAATAVEVGSTNVDNSCQTYTPFRITNVSSGSRFTILPQPSSFTFTSRGTVANLAADPQVIRITNTSGGTVYCLTLEGLLGVQTIGKYVSGSCQT